ncbi:MAG: hypothetical protein GX022_06315 [Clostridiaceae bacterium]|nr:hypothetical protein [Clostridiaceae bacterium]
MDDTLELFAIKDALFEFYHTDLYSASLGLLKAMQYPVKLHSDNVNQKIEEFIYFTVPNKVYYSQEEMRYLNRIETVSFLCELHHSELINNKESSNLDTDSIVFIAIEINSPERDRSVDLYYISQILNKTYDGFVVIIAKSANNIMFSTCIEKNIVFMSEWYNINSSYTDIIPLCAICYSNILGARTIEDFYYELVYGFSREYLLYNESFEFTAYQLFPYIDDFTNYCCITKQQIMEVANQNFNYYKEKYGFDFVEPDNSFAVLLEEDDEWALLIELEDYKSLDEFENCDDFEDKKQYIEYSGLDDEILKDPVKLLNWLKQRYTEKNKKIKYNVNASSNCPEIDVVN